MSWEAWLTLAVIALAVVLLAREVTVPAAVVFGATVTLLVAGVLEPAEAFQGFSNPAPITVAALYVVAGAIEKTGILGPLVQGFLGGGSSERMALARLLIPAAGASAFLNNTPIVAMLVPAVSQWAARTGRSLSRYLMPLSFAAILGGMVTLIGTSTNLIVSGLMQAHGLEPIGFFEISKIGLPIALACLGSIVLLAPVVIPDRRAARRDLQGDVREFVVEMTVTAGGPLDGLTVEEAGLRSLSGVFLFQVDRMDGEVVAAVSPRIEIHGGDRLRFVGRASDIVDLQARRGLVPEAQDHITGFDTTRLAFFEAVVGPASPLVGHTLKEMQFRGRYQAAVVAIHRADQRVEGKLGEVRIRVGDTLLMISGPNFRSLWHDRNDFLLVSRLGEAEPLRSAKAPIAALIGIGVVVAAATGMMDILEASLLGAIATVAFGVLSPSEAAGAVNLNVIVVIASAFGLGAALEVTGLADKVAGGLMDGLEGFGSWAVLLGIALMTQFLNAIITNNAASVLMFPIAISAASSLGADPRGFAIAMAVSASASFLTPIAYQTNTMVWGPGGYRFTDYPRLGAPLEVLTVLGVTLLTPLAWVV
jgi:di/tricarboxylate transporter